MTEEARADGLPEDIAGIFRLDGQRTIVTGAASGLGRAIALGFAHFGADVACLDIDLEGAERAAEEVSALGREGYACWSSRLTSSPRCST
jgi:NAD(P)-dependent dehydrogenase (short-subunit alcohol dehydrogenase family)